jgi:hypothetical protein
MKWEQATKADVNRRRMNRFPVNYTPRVETEKMNSWSAVRHESAPCFWAVSRSQAQLLLLPSDLLRRRLQNSGWGTGHPDKELKKHKDSDLMEGRSRG